jgi:hypothetical protein
VKSNEINHDTSRAQLGKMVESIHAEELWREISNWKKKVIGSWLDVGWFEHDSAGND